MTLDTAEGSRTFRWKKSSTGSSSDQVAFQGEITESSDLLSVELALGAHANVDLADIVRINSMGVKSWLQFMARCKQSGKHLTFVRCSPVIVGQLNIVNSFRAGAMVESVMAPFVCPDCDHEATLEVDVRKEPLDQIAVGMVCSECDAAMEFDDIPDLYLSFTKKV